jgi:hypothetical protein
MMIERLEASEGFHFHRLRLQLYQELSNKRPSENRAQKNQDYATSMRKKRGEQ